MLSGLDSRTSADPRPVLEALPVAVLIADPAGVILFANAAAGSLLGWPAPELAGRPLNEVIPPRHDGATVARLRDGDEVAVGLSRAPASTGEGGALEVLTLTPRPARDGTSAAPGPHSPRYLRATTRTALTLGTGLEPGRVAETVVEAMVADFDAAMCCVWLTDDESGLLRLRAVGGPAASGLTGHLACKVETLPPAPVAAVLRDRAPFVREGLADLADFDQRWVARERIAAVAALPLLCAGRVHGAVIYYGRGPLPGELIDALSAFATIVAAALNDVKLLAREQAARVEAEEQRQRLQTILEVMPVGVALAEGPEPRLTILNAAGRAIWGDLRDVPIDEAFDERYPLLTADGRRLPIAERPLLRALLRGERAHEMGRYRRDDGVEFYLEVATAPFPGPRGGAVSIYRDVTEHLRLESQRDERAAQLKALLDHLPVGVAYFDRDGACRACNGPARRILARRRDEIIGAPADELFAQDGLADLRDGLLRCVRDQAPHAQAGVAWPESMAGAGPRHLDWRFEPLPSDPARPRGALALIVDVTDRTRAEAALRRAMEAADQASRNKTQFLSAVSHDLRTPVNALSLQAELLERVVAGRDDSDGDLAMLAADIRQAAANLIELVNDLLDLTRFDSGLVEHRPTSFRLVDWLSGTLAPLEVMAHSKGLEFSWKVDRPGRVVHADRVKLSRVLVNLAGNAVKFTESGSVQVAAGASADGGLVVSVRDTGPGIPDDQKERIFDEMVQLRNPERDRTKGTGLGLAICRRLVQAVGGRLTVESRVGQGSTFTAWYPADHLPPRPAEEPARSGGSSDSFAAVDAPILLVEDDHHSRNALARLLMHSGYRVEAAPDGPKALAILERVRPALIFLDLMMPGMDGIEVLGRIRARPDGRGIPVVVLSGDITGGRTAEFRALDVDGILSKPVDFQELLAAVTRHASPPAKRT